MYDGVIDKPELNGLFLAHHGVKGQKWGVQNGPPYPLSEEKQKKLASNIKSDIESYHKKVQTTGEKQAEEESDIIQKYVVNDLVSTDKRMGQIATLAYASQLVEQHPTNEKLVREFEKEAEKFRDEFVEDMFGKVKDEPITIFEGFNKDIIIKSQYTLGEFASEAVEDLIVTLISSEEIRSAVNSRVK